MELIFSRNFQYTLGGVQKLYLQELSFFDHLPPSVYIFYGIKVCKKMIFFDHLLPCSWNVVCELYGYQILNRGIQNFLFSSCQYVKNQSGFEVWIDSYVLTWWEKDIFKFGSLMIYALSICTWFLKNQVGKIEFDKLDF